MRTTLRQVAEASHLSITIVSQVLNNKPCRVSDKNRELILEKAKELNYRPNQVAVSLVKGSTKTIGLVIPDIRNDFFSDVAKCAADECLLHGWNLILCNSDDRHAEDMVNLQTLADRGVSGIILAIASETTPEMLEECTSFLEQQKIPVVLVDRGFDEEKYDRVGVDHVSGGFLAAEYLLKTGHRKIACITGPHNMQDSMRRLQGYQKALQKWKIPFEEKRIAVGKYTYDSGIKAMRELLAADPDIDAVFAFNDMMAVGAMKQLQDAGIRIPDQVSVIGYDDIFMAPFMSVPLTTIHQPTGRLGRAAVRLIIGKSCEEKQSREQIIFKPELVIRQSVRERTV